MNPVACYAGALIMTWAVDRSKLVQSKFPIRQEAVAELFLLKFYGRMRKVHRRSFLHVYLYSRILTGPHEELYDREIYETI